MKSSLKMVSYFAFVLILIVGLHVSGCVPSAAAQQIQVTAADPPAASQGTVNLNVLIKGKGFKNGALAKFFVTGTTNPGGIKVNSTTFRGATELLANIDIADAAELAKFDIQVQNADGRTGKGTELFSVTVKGSSQGIIYEAEFLDTTPQDPTWDPRLRSDGLGPYRPVDVNVDGYGFRMDINQTQGRSVVYQFNDPDRVNQNPLTCQQWGSGTPYTRDYPAYMLSTDKLVVPYHTLLMTTWELVYDDQLSKWVRIVDRVKGRTTYYRNLSLLSLAPGQKAYGQMVIQFQVTPSGDYYYVNFNDTFRRDLIGLVNGMVYSGGILEVEAAAGNRGDVGDTWYIRPISSRFPVLGNPPELIPQYQANHTIYDMPDLQTDPGGNCDLGNFFMKFELKIKRVQ